MRELNETRALLSISHFQATGVRLRGGFSLEQMADLPEESPCSWKDYLPPDRRFNSLRRDSSFFILHPDLIRSVIGPRIEDALQPFQGPSHVCRSEAAEEPGHLKLCPPPSRLGRWRVGKLADEDSGEDILESEHINQHLMRPRFLLQHGALVK